MSVSHFKTQSTTVYVSLSLQNPIYDGVCQFFTSKPNLRRCMSVSHFKTQSTTVYVSFSLKNPIYDGVCQFLTSKPNLWRCMSVSHFKTQSMTVYVSFSLQNPIYDGVLCPFTYLTFAPQYATITSFSKKVMLSVIGSLLRSFLCP
jgi:hypothetical protein